MWVEGWISFKQTCFWILHIWIELLGKQPMGKRAQNKLNNPAALCVFMLGDSGWEAQRPFQNSRKDWLQRMPGMLRNPSLVCQRQQEADARRDRPSRMSFKEKKKDLNAMSFIAEEQKICIWNNSSWRQSTTIIGSGLESFDIWSHHITGVNNISKIIESFQTIIKPADADNRGENANDFRVNTHNS